MADRFIYSTLPKDHIRLLTISGNLHSEMTCELNDFPLNMLPEFYALSYTWGYNAATENILLNRDSKRIADNLYEAIHTLYSPPLSLNLPIWIDAICINQRDEGEKSDQVRRMGHIYGKARQVVVWLGPSGNNSDIAMDWLERLTIALPLIPLPPSVQSLPEHGLPGELDPLWAALGHLYRRNWFGRLWTFQEVVLGTNVLMVCGSKANGWETLAIVARELNRLRLYPFCVGYQAIKLHEDGFRAMETVSFARMVLADYGPLRFPTLLMIADTKLVTDPRDRVYGMLGLTSKGFRDRIPISYASGKNDYFVQTYIDCAKACIEEYNEMSPILQLVAGRPKISGLPSWCPNMSANQGTILPFGEYVHAGISPELTSFHPPQISSNSNILSITGFRVDIVSEVIEGTFHWPHTPNDQQIPRAMRFLDWESRCLCLAQKTFPSTPQAIPIGHIFTLTANTRARISKEQDIDLYQVYLDIMVNIRKNAEDGGTAHPPPERQPIYNDSWQQIFRYCAGRRYFSTEAGRLGLGPPDIMKGDCICVFYGSGPVHILHAVDKGGDSGWLLKGDAFVHELMELSETPMVARGADELFRIF